MAQSPKSQQSLSWIDVLGRWEFLNDGTIICHGVQKRQPSEVPSVALSSCRIGQGQISVTAEFPDVVGEARILFGYSSDTGSYLSAGLGGWDFGYSIQEMRQGVGIVGHAVGGARTNLQVGKKYRLKVTLRGSRVTLDIDNVQVLSHTLIDALPGEQVGLCIVGEDQDVNFTDFSIADELGDLFVAMQFGEPYDSLYTDVIKKVAKEEGFHAFRADDVYGPGIILEDIVRSLIQSQVIAVEITPPNPNVFYELGYAHALNKPTILLAEKGRSLPFDVSGYRVIFYHNTIGGKSKVEAELRKHLRAIRVTP